MAISKARRRLLQAAGLASVGLTVYSYQRGVRFPTLTWEPREAARQYIIANLSLELDNLIASEITEDSNILRAYAPEPSLRIKSRSSAKFEVTIHNIFPDAQLIAPEHAQLNEQIDGISRHLTMTVSDHSDFILRWELPAMGTYQFAAIGDTGGGQELAWCINRAKQLGARFLLHLGDFNYQAGDYDSAISLLNNAPLPCFVSVGNHDFHDNGLIYPQFLQEIGPLNHQFSIGKTRFINLDTAANTLPFSAGHRGRLLQTAVDEKNLFNDTVAFTHRPLHDPIDDGTDSVGSKGERDWLVTKLKEANISTLLSGHLHVFDRRMALGIDNIIVGQGLGHQDLITNSDHSRIAIGQVSEDGAVSYQFPNLAMPMGMHCHPRTERVKKELRGGPHADLIREVDNACIK